MDIDYYSITEDEEKEVWKNGLFVFDTSPLLNLYKFSETAIKEIEEKTFQKISRRVFMPFQVIYEFKKNWNKQIQDTVTEYTGIRKNVETIEQQLKQISNKIKKADKHPVLKKKRLKNLQRSLMNLSHQLLMKLRLTLLLLKVILMIQ